MIYMYVCIYIYMYFLKGVVRQESRFGFKASGQGVNDLEAKLAVMVGVA